MNTSIRGRLAAAALCALLAACGGGGGNPPATVLPASVTISNDARADAGTATSFKTNLATTTGLTLHWDFGDGSTAEGATTTHAYARPGVYQVTLAVANTDEDLRTATSTIQVGAYANVAGLACSQADSAGWCWQHAIVTGHQVNDIFFVDATHAWAVGDDMTILKSTDGGSTWAQVAVDPALARASLQSVRFYDANHGMALGSQGGALQTSDGGSTWTFASLSGIIYGSPLTFVDYSASRIILQSGYGSGGAMSTDGGATWTYVAAYGPIQTVSNDCWSLSSSNLVRAAGCGATLDQMLSSYVSNGYESFMAGAFTSDTQAFVIGSGYSYSTYTQATQGWSTTDGGATWTTFQPNGLPPYYYYGMSLHMTDAQSGVLYAPSGLTAYATTNAGHDWTLVAPAASLGQASVYNQATGFAGSVLWQSVGNHLALSADRGQTWQEATIHDEDTATQQYWQAGAAVVKQYVDAGHFVVAINHRFYATGDGGQTFRRLLGPDPRDAGAQFAAGEFSDFHHGRFLTTNGALLATADGGRTWTRSDYPDSSGNPVALHFTSATEGWLVLGGKLAHSTDGGATWSTPLTDSAMTNLQGMSWGDATHAWVWNSGKLFYSVDAGAHWTLAVLPNSMGVTSAVMTGPLTGAATTGYGPVATTQDGGATWQVGSASGQFGTLVRGSGQTVWSLAFGLMRSKDGGRTWQPTGLVLGNGVPTGLSFADDSHGWLVTSAGEVLRTTDGGDSWMAQPVGADLVLRGVVAVDPMTAWIITRDGQILSTATGGQ